MIDRIAFWIFGILDNFSTWIDSLFKTKPKKKKKNKPSQEDLFNGE